MGNFEHIKDFYLPVIDILQASGGKAHVNEICAQFENRYKDQLDPSYFTEIKDGDIKWRDYINRAGYQLVKKGYIVRGEKRGTWQLTDKPLPNSEDGF